VHPPISESIDAIAKETDFSGVVHVARQGRLLYGRAWGLADRAHGIANTLDTQFGIASGTKGFTALAVMSLCPTEHSLSAHRCGAFWATSSSSSTGR
jgi:CubicO group peptidase (beta-lactamase class C family)